MTNKEQIIISGVDVSGCDFLAKTDIYNSYSGVTTAYKGQCGCSDDEMCKDHRNCGYKKLARQLQRKTAECEELKNQVDEDYNYYTTELKTLRDIISNKEKINAALFLMSNRYRKALEEIEKYTREQFCDNCEDISSTEYNCHCEYCEYQEYFDIIAKAKDGK